MIDKFKGFLCPADMENQSQKYLSLQCRFDFCWLTSISPSMPITSWKKTTATLMTMLKKLLTISGTCCGKRNPEREYLDEKTYNSIVNFRRVQAQQYLLGQSPISLAQLGYLFGVCGVPLSRKDEIWSDLYKTSESILRSRSLRILLTELPQIKGSTKVYKQQVEEKIRRFRARLFMDCNAASYSSCPGGDH